MKTSKQKIICFLIITFYLLSSLTLAQEIFPVYGADLVGKKLILSAGDGSSGNSESDFYFYADGSVDYVLRSHLDTNPASNKMLWQLEDGILFVNVGNKKLGNGLKAAKEIRFLGPPRAGTIVLIKYGNGVFDKLNVLAIEKIPERADFSLTDDVFIGKTIAYSIDGGTNEINLSRLTFYEDYSGYWQSRSYKKEFIWRIENNKLELDYGSNKYTILEFTKPLDIGDEILSKADVLGNGRPISSSYFIVSVD